MVYCLISWNTVVCYIPGVDCVLLWTITLWYNLENMKDVVRLNLKYPSLHHFLKDKPTPFLYKVSHCVLFLIRSLYPWTFLTLVPSRAETRECWGEQGLHDGREEEIIRTQVKRNECMIAVRKRQLHCKTCHHLTVKVTYQQWVDYWNLLLGQHLLPLKVIHLPSHHAQIIAEEPENESRVLNTSTLNLLIMNVLAASNVGNRWKN